MDNTTAGGGAGLQRRFKMKNKQKNKEKITFICFLVASICFYISGIISIVSKDGSNGAVNICLGSAFLCLSTTHLNKEKNKRENENEKK